MRALRPLRSHVTRPWAKDLQKEGTRSALRPGALNGLEISVETPLPGKTQRNVFSLVLRRHDLILEILHRALFSKPHTSRCAHPAGRAALCVAL